VRGIFLVSDPYADFFFCFRFSFFPFFFFFEHLRHSSYPPVLGGFLLNLPVSIFFSIALLLLFFVFVSSFSGMSVFFFCSFLLCVFVYVIFCFSCCSDFFCVFCQDNYSSCASEDNRRQERKFFSVITLLLRVIFRTQTGPIDPPFRRCGHCILCFFLFASDPFPVEFSWLVGFLLED